MDIKKIIGPLIDNYDLYSRKLLQTFALQNMYYTCPYSVDEAILKRQCYSCTVHLWLFGKLRCLPNAFPVMIGSQLDFAFRYLHKQHVRLLDLDTLPNILSLHQLTTTQTNVTTDLTDIAVTCFVINGLVKQIPHYIINDVTNVHVVKNNNNVIRVYNYVNEGHGKELSLINGTLKLRLTNGQEICSPSDEQLNDFFKSPYTCSAWTKLYMRRVFSKGFSIDHLANKVTFTPGHIFYRLFVKSLYGPVNQEADWPKVQTLFHKLVSKTIVNGDFGHIFSKKIKFYKDIEHSMALKEITSTNKVFTEKKTTCYREVNLQSYQLIPYLSQTVFFHISEKVKTRDILSFKDSHVGYLCICSTAETKNIGRQTMFCRDVYISSCAQHSLEDVYAALNIDLATTPADFFIVVNGACIGVTSEYFQNINLRRLKQEFHMLELYVDENFIFVNYKPGLMFKNVDASQTELMVTPRETPFWSSPPVTFPFITSYMMDLIPYFHHNAYPKNVLAVNALRNSILSRTPLYSKHFKETTSSYCIGQDACFRPVLEPENDFSKPWTIHLPKLDVMFSSFRGLTQEDCIVLVDENLTCFDTVKTFTLKIKFLNKGCKYFRSSEGSNDNSNSSTFLGTISCYGSELQLQVQTMNVNVVPVSRHCSHVFFLRPGFRISFHEICDNDYLFIGLEMPYPCQNADKICNMMGQKGVVRQCRGQGPYGMTYEGKIRKPQLIVNPEALIKRQTVGMIKEMMAGGGQDYPRVYNSRGRLLAGQAFIGPSFYFLINYRSREHLYMGNKCARDKITGQPLRGRTRQGGMKIGFQEITNCLRANGLAACYKEKILENSDGIINAKGVCIPRSAMVIEQDYRFYKVKTQLQTQPAVTLHRTTRNIRAE